MKSKISPTAIGVFIAGAIVILFGSVLLFGSSKLFRKTKDYLLTFQEPVSGLDVGAPVKLLGVNIGTVKQITVGWNETNHAALINVIIEVDRQKVDAAFDNSTIELEDRERFESIVHEAGLRGQLDILSLLSGQLYIALGMHPEEAGFQLGRAGADGLWEIPTIPSQKRELMQSLLSSLEDVSQMDLKGTAGDLRALLDDLRTDLAALQLQRSGSNLVGTLGSVRQLLDNPQLAGALTNLNSALAQIDALGRSLNPRMDPLLDQVSQELQRAGAMFDQASGALSQLERQVNPDSALLRELVRTLEQAGTSLNALRQLADEIERNPSVLITGKKESKESKP